MIMLLLASVHTLRAQEASAQRGFQPGNSYAVSDFETINTTNGNLMLNFNLGSLAPGRGGISGWMGLRYNSKMYDSDMAVLTDHSNQLTMQSYLVETDTQGWQPTSSLNYQIRIVNRSEVEDGPYQCVGDEPYFNNRAVYVWKVKVIYPDGAEREFRPEGFQDVLTDGYFNVSPSTGQITGQSTGSTGCQFGSQGTAPNPLNYFSTDGTYTRLVITRGTGWVLSFPDGSRVEGANFGGAQIFYDRNGNYVTYGSVTLPNGHVAGGLVDQVGHYVVVDSNPSLREDYYYSLGFNNQLLMWTVKWKSIAVLKPYETSPVSSGRGRGTTSSQTFNGGFNVVDTITLPSQAGTLSYHFSYNGVDVAPGGEATEYTTGWGEISGITLPTGAQVAYQYLRDSSHPVDPEHPFRPHTREVLDNSISDKTVSYQAEYDGNSSPVTEHWVYDIGRFGSTITGPDNSVTIQLHNHTASGLPDAGLVFFEQHPNGETIERTWQTNQPSVMTGMLSNQQANFYVKREFRSIPSAAGTMILTAIKEFIYDKNGNVTRVAEYDWIPYSTAHAAGFSTSSLVPARVTNTSYKNPTVSAEDGNSEQSNAYWNLAAKPIRNLPASSEVQGYLNGNPFVVARTEFEYDQPNSTGNLTRKTSWDSSKGAYSNPLCTDPGLCAVNSISILTQYNAYGSPTLVTDARGFQTKIDYDPVSGVSDLYPTQTRTAFGTAVQRHETRAYDFYSGRVTQVTDNDNGVSTSMSYDAFGRPTLVTSAEGSHTTTEYSDTLRRVIVRSDLFAINDLKLVTIQYYDQLGRVRLTRQLEDSTTQSATDETQGIKVQTRFLISGSNSYQIVSNPYRAAFSTTAGPENSMGWTRITNDKGGRTIEVQTFGGAAAPAPWANNTNTTGAVTTSYDGQNTVVTDQAGKIRRSVIDGLGQLARVDEPDKDSGQLDDTNDQPIQSTNYTYNALGNLTNVAQGGQTRTFLYTSLGRLASSTNPESGTINYLYDENGNLIQKIDPRIQANQTHITTTYEYDALNRIKTRTYNDGTPDVTYTYDTVSPNGKGRLAAISSSVSTNSYNEYDPMGRVRSAGVLISGQLYTSAYEYDPAGHLKKVTYPSGNAVNYVYDNAGRANSVTGNLGAGGNSRNYSSGISYDAAGRMRQEQLGTTIPLYNKLFYNSRGQLAEIREGTTPDDTSWQRGAIINFYDTCWGMCWDPNTQTGSSMPINNGNLRVQQLFIPRHDGAGYDTDNPYIFTQGYDYDALNRLHSVDESNSLQVPAWRQQYSYDRFGNRTIDGSNATDGIPRPQFSISTDSNKLFASGETDSSHFLIDYDAAGNQKKDHYTENLTGVHYDRTYDADNRISSSTKSFTNQSPDQNSIYSYDGDGRRVKRLIASVETWQVYGVGGELLAEYSAGTDHLSPQKEYGYRNGQLLISADAASAGWGPAPPIDDNPLNPPGQPKTDVKAIHITQLRAAINALRAHHNLPDYQWQKPTASGGAINNTVYISWEPIDEMRSALNEALGPPSSPYADGLAHDQPIKAIHIQELRDRVLGAWNSGSGVDLRWLVTDQLGTPRMIFDQSGSLATTSRHDYLPFGEELTTQGGRSASIGYGGDLTRQKFTQKERDTETGLDYFGARYYGSAQGRFISADPLMASAQVQNPQSWNRYTYALNNPLKYVDPEGLKTEFAFYDYDKLTDEERRILEHSKVKLGTGKDAKTLSGRELYDYMKNGNEKMQKDLAGFLNLTAGLASITFSNGRTASSYIQSINGFKKGERIYANVESDLFSQMESISSKQAKVGVRFVGPGGQAVSHEGPDGINYDVTFRENIVDGSMQLSFASKSPGRLDMDADEKGLNCNGCSKAAHIAAGINGADPKNIYRSFLARPDQQKIQPSYQIVEKK